MVSKFSLSFWQKDGVVGAGNSALLEQPLTAFFASRRCSGRAILAAMDWAVVQARTKNPLIGGFHSPLEQSVLEVMMAAHAPVVIVIARKLAQASLPVVWCDAAVSGTIAIVCMNNTQPRLTAELAIRRNHWIAQRAEQIVVAEASSGGRLATCIAQWKIDRKHVSVLFDGMVK